MARRNPFLSAPASFEVKVGQNAFMKEYELELLTPLLGGGSRSWETDEKYPVRIPSIRGQLRYWWRTMQPAGLKRRELLQREQSIWGSTEQASRVKLSARVLTSENEMIWKTLEKNERGLIQNYMGMPSYVLFPLQGQNERNQFNILQNLTFRLRVECPSELEPVVVNTLKLWVLFGGMGARTRRGGGSITCKELVADLRTVADLRAFVQSVAGGNRTGVESTFPVLEGCRLAVRVAPNQPSPKDVWNTLLEQYQKFRQGPGCGRNPKNPATQRPGRTRWPEADAIRRITGQYGHHQPEHPAGNWFPRGAYGLPIQTEFRGESTDPPGMFMLQPEEADRWPSPVILKAIRLGDGTLLYACLVLNSSVPSNLVLKGNRMDHDLTESEKPMSWNGKTMPQNAPLKTGKDPYSALIEFLRLEETE